MPALLLVRVRHVARRQISYRCLSSRPPHDTGTKPEGAFDKGLPFLFKSNASLFSLVTILGLVMGYNAYQDSTAHPDELDRTPREDGERQVRQLPDGRILMSDGSIVKSRS